MVRMVKSLEGLGSTVVNIHLVRDVLSSVISAELKEGKVLSGDIPDFAFERTIIHNCLLYTLVFSKVGTKMRFNFTTKLDMLEFEYDIVDNSTSIVLRSNNPDVLAEYEQLYSAVVKYAIKDFRNDCIKHLKINKGE